MKHFVTLNRMFSEIYTDDPVPRPNPDGDEISPTPINRKVVSYMQRIVK